MKELKAFVAMLLLALSIALMISIFSDREAYDLMVQERARIDVERMLNK